MVVVQHSNAWTIRMPGNSVRFQNITEKSLLKITYYKLTSEGHHLPLYILKLDNTDHDKRIRSSLHRCNG